MTPCRWIAFVIFKIYNQRRSGGILSCVLYFRIWHCCGPGNVYRSSCMCVTTLFLFFAYACACVQVHIKWISMHALCVLCLRLCFELESLTSLCCSISTYPTFLLCSRCFYTLNPVCACIYLVEAVPAPMFNCGCVCFIILHAYIRVYLCCMIVTVVVCTCGQACMSLYHVCHCSLTVHKLYIVPLCMHVWQCMC